MAELTQFQSEGASTAQFQSAPIVTPDTQASEINLFSSLAGGVMDGYAKHQESKANQANQAKINTFTDKLGRLAQVGEKDGTPQMNNMRVAYLKTIAQDPSNEEEYTKMFKRQTGQEPLAPSAADVQYAKAEEEARASNMIHIGANAEQVAAGIEAYQAQVAQEEAWTHDNKLIENKLKNEQLSTVERENVQREKKEKANEQVKSLATTGLVSLGNELQELTTSDMTVEQQVMALDQMELDFEDRLSKKLMDSADSTLVDIVRSSYESRIGIARSVIDGSRTVAEATRQVEHLEAVQKLMLVADPTGRLFSLMGLVPETTHSLILQHANFANIGSMAMDISNPDTKVTPNVYDKPDETAVAYVFAREYMKPGSSPEQEKVGEEIYNTYIDAAIVNEAQIESPKEVVPTVEALATPEGQKWAQNNPDRAADVGNHLLRHYNDNIQEEMTQRLQDQITVTLPRTGLAPNFYATTGAEYLVLVDSDAGYNFMINPDADLPHDGLRPQLNELAQKLNKPLGKYTKAMMNVGAKESLDASMQTLRAFALPETNLALPQEEPEVEPVERVAELNADEIEAVAILGGESAGSGYIGSNRESRLVEIRKNVGLAEDGSEDKDARAVLEQNMLDNPDRATRAERAKQRRIGVLERQLSGEDSLDRAAFRNLAEYRAGVQAELDELRGVQGEEAEVTPVGKSEEVDLDMTAESFAEMSDEEQRQWQADIGVPQEDIDSQTNPAFGPKTQAALKEAVEAKQAESREGQQVTLIKEAMAGRESNNPSDIFGDAVPFFPDNYDVTQNTIADVLEKGSAAVAAINKANDELFKGEEFTDEDRAFKAANDARTVHDVYGKRGYVIPSGASGTYQIITKTLRGAVANTPGVSLTDTYDEETQDKLALGLAMGRSAIKKFVNGTGEEGIEAALVDLGKEWEAFKKPEEMEAGRELLRAMRDAK